MTTAPEIMHKFDTRLYARVREERKKRGLSVAALNEALPNHEWVGKKVVNRKTGKVYLVIGVYREWYLGWFTKCLFVNDANSHGGCILTKEHSHTPVEIHEHYELATCGLCKHWKETEAPYGTCKHQQCVKDSRETYDCFESEVERETEDAIS